MIWSMNHLDSCDWRALPCFAAAILRRNACAMDARAIRALKLNVRPTVDGWRITPQITHRRFRRESVFRQRTRSSQCRFRQSCCVGCGGKGKHAAIVAGAAISLKNRNGQSLSVIDDYQGQSIGAVLMRSRRACRRQLKEFTIEGPGHNAEGL